MGWVTAPAIVRNPDAESPTGLIGETTGPFVAVDEESSPLLTAQMITPTTAATTTSAARTAISRTGDWRSQPIARSCGRRDSTGRVVICSSMQETPSSLGKESCSKLARNPDVRPEDPPK